MYISIILLPVFPCIGYENLNIIHYALDSLLFKICTIVMTDVTDCFQFDR